MDSRTENDKAVTKINLWLAERKVSEASIVGCKLRLTVQFSLLDATASMSSLLSITVEFTENLFLNFREIQGPMAQGSG